MVPLLRIPCRCRNDRWMRNTACGILARDRRMLRRSGKQAREKL